MSTAAGSSASPTPPPRSQDPTKGTGHRTITVKIPKSGGGFHKQLPKWTVTLEKNLQELPGYIIKMHGGTAATWQRVTTSDAKSWAQMGAAVFDGLTFEPLDSSEIRHGPMLNPCPIPSSGLVATQVTETTSRIEAALETSHDEEFVTIQIIRKLFSRHCSLCPC